MQFLLPIIFIFALGLGFLLYPLLANAYNDWIHNNLINSYDQEVEKMVPEDCSSWLEAAENYNASLVGEGVPDAFAVHAQDADSAYLSQLNFRDNGVMGYIKIPRINVNLPIYHTTSDEVMQKGAGHLQGSALPVGGPSTHCVISAHRGLPSAAMFTDLDQLNNSDKFFLKVLNRTCEYEIDQIKVVLPDETSDLDVKRGEDYCTLVTCTPYGVNSHRLLVRGHRVPYDENDETKEALNSTVGPFTNYAMWIFGSLAVVALFAVVVMKRSRDCQQHERLKRQYGYTSKND